MTTSASVTSSSNVIASTLNFKCQQIQSRQRTDSVSTTTASISAAHKSTIRNSFNWLRRMVVGARNQRQKRFRRQKSNSEIYGNDANIMALSCTAADEETVPLSPNRAERIVCKNHRDADNIHSKHSEYLEQRAELTKGTPSSSHALFFVCSLQ